MSEVLAQLKKKGGGYKIYSLGALAATTPATYNATSIPNYHNLIADDFVLSADGIFANSSANISYTKTYDANNGILTVTRGSGAYVKGELLVKVKM